MPDRSARESTPPASAGDAGGATRSGIVLRLRSSIDMGPGRADLLGAIDEAGSISGAARAVGMSYRKAWRLIDQMNHEFRDPVVETAFGGSRGGGARLTATGRAVFRAYREMERKITAAAREELDILDHLGRHDGA